MSFTKDLKKFEIDTLDKYDKVLRSSALDLFSAVVLSTPVDKGVLRNNWFVGIGSGSKEKTDAADSQGNTTISKINAGLKKGDRERSIFLTNNLPYGPTIEFDGHSKHKAPAGMVRINTARWDKIVKRNIRKTGGG